MLCPFVLVGAVVVSAWSADALALPTKHAAAEAQALLEWLLTNDRLEPTAVELRPSLERSSNDRAKFLVSTTRAVSRGEVLFRLSSDSVWSASDAYQDRDLGPKFRDLGRQAGPGFGVVALSGVLAAERVRRYRSIEGQGNAPESTGFSIPSRRGAFARWLWSAHDNERMGTDIDESLMGTVLQGVKLVVPLLDVTARRAWTAAAADDATPPFLSEEWARQAMYNDGSALSWSRSELESVAMRSFELVLKRQRPPPPFLVSGVGSLIPEPFLDRGQAPETWPSGEPLALVPMVDDLYSDQQGGMATNAVLGSPPRGQRLGEKDCLWCVATRDLKAEERIVAADPWDV
jgi:hypothetical protein